jgi:hypothetical protein
MVFLLDPLHASRFPARDFRSAALAKDAENIPFALREKKHVTLR